MRPYFTLFASFVLLSSVRCAPSRARNGSSEGNTQDAPTRVERSTSIGADNEGRELVEGILRDEGYAVSSFEWESTAWIGKKWEELLGAQGVTAGRLYWVLGRPIALPCSGDVRISGKWAAMKSTWRGQPDEQFRWQLVSVPPTTRSVLEKEYCFRATDGDQLQKIYIPGLLIAEASMNTLDGQVARISVPLEIKVSVGNRVCPSRPTPKVP